MKNRNNKLMGMLSRVAEMIGILVLAAALFLASGNPGYGAYEVSIYQAYPPWFWGLVAAVICLGLIALSIEIFLQDSAYGWLRGFALVVAANTLILLLPYLRDYAFADQWDPTNHYSSALSILEYGRPDAENFYPISHVLATTVSLITRLDLQAAILLSPTFFYILYLANMGFLAWTLDTRPQVRGIVMALASPLIFHSFGTIFRPVQLATCMLPFFVGWLWWTRVQKTDRASRVVLLLLLLFLPFLHPLGVFAAATLVFMFAAVFAWRQVRHSRSLSHRVGPDTLLTPLYILIVGWLAWFMSFSIFGIALRRLVGATIYALEGTQSLANYVDHAQRAALSLAELLSLIIFTYGSSVLYFGVAAAALVLVIIRRAHRRFEVLPYIPALAAFAVVFVALAALSLFRDLITSHPLRLYNFALAFVPVLIAGSLYDSLLDRNTSEIPKGTTLLTAVILFVVVSIASILTMFGSYYSPLTGQPNHQVSYAQQAGVGFLVDKAADDDSLIYSPFGGTFVLASVMNIEELRQLRQESSRWWVWPAPAHFGDGPDDLGIEFYGNGYLWVTAHEKAYYTEVWPEGGRFNPMDFERLESDPDWNQVYVSGDFTLWRRRLDD